MKRLTFVKGERRWHQGRNPTPYSSRETFQSVCDRLGKIEDILGDEYDLDELREMVQAKRDGRCVVLPPIKVGDTAFYLINNQIFSGIVYYIRWEKHKYLGEYGLISADGVCGVFSANLSDFGKRVFLTRAEADAALRREQDG